MILCLEGIVPHPEDDEPAEGQGTEADSGQVWAAYSKADPVARKSFEAAGARTLEDGVIGGVSGALLVQGIGRDVAVERFRELTHRVVAPRCRAVIALAV